mmetsp:Transcript_11957/g.15095  ORF Transcript_11957/g.15095 Transcript_11957/m.15095 type:complete len:86 (-) Transcript_11957:126-383(-)
MYKGICAFPQAGAVGNIFEIAQLLDSVPCDVENAFLQKRKYAVKYTCVSSPPLQKRNTQQKEGGPSLMYNPVTSQLRFCNVLLLE